MLVTHASSSAACISARLDRLPATRTIWQLVALLSLGFFFELYDLFYSGYITPGLIKGGVLNGATGGPLGLSGPASFIASLFAGMFVGTLVCGFLADRFGRRAIFTVSLLWYTAANTIMALQDHAAGLNFWRFMAGLGIGVELVTIGTYTCELVPRHIRGRAFACVQAVGFTAVPLVAFLSWWLVPRSPLGVDGWRWVVLIGSQAALPVWWIRRRLPESPRWLALQGRAEEADRIMRDLEAKVSIDCGHALPAPMPATQDKRASRFRDMWRPPYRRRVLMLSIFHVFQAIGFYGFAQWVPTLLIKQGVTVTSSLMYSSIIALAAPVGPLMGLFMADRYERKTVIVTAAGLSMLCGLCYVHASTPTLLIGLGVALSLANHVMSYSFHAYQAELFPTGIRARAVGFVYSWSRCSAIFNAFIIAALLEHFGSSGVFVFISGAMAVVMLSIGLSGPRTKGRTLEDIAA